MTREECIALLERYAEYHGMGIPNLAGCREAMKMAADLLSQPSLPSDLDEAAEKYAKGEGLENALGGWEDMSDAFKAGAEWGSEHLRDSTKMIPDRLEEAAENIYKTPFGTRAEDFIAGAEWCINQCPLPEDTTIFLNGVAEGRRLEKNDNISLIESRIGEILGDAQPAPVLRAELRELIDKIKNY